MPDQQPPLAWAEQMASEVDARPSEYLSGEGEHAFQARLGLVQSTPLESRKAAWALCRHESCGHRWVVVYLPMDLMRAATAMKRATCPMCGDTRPYAYAPPADGGEDV